MTFFNTSGCARLLYVEIQCCAQGHSVRCDEIPHRAHRAGDGVAFAVDEFMTLTVNKKNIQTDYSW